MYKELGDGNLLSDNIENGEVFPVGGSRFGIIDTHMQVDYDSFSELFGLIEKNAKYLMSVPTIKSWYENQKSDLDFSLFCHMMAFNNVIKLKYPDIINMHNHNRFYDRQEPKKLSDAIDQKACACTELAVLAQGYFQQQNIPTRYVGGELVINNHFDDFEAHSFIAFTADNKKYIYDPVNPVRTNNDTILPRISEILSPEERLYVDTRNLFDKSANWCYSGGEKGAFLKDLPTRKNANVAMDIFNRNGGRD